MVVHPRPSSLISSALPGSPSPVVTHTHTHTHAHTHTHTHFSRHNLSSLSPHVSLFVSHFISSLPLSLLGHSPLTVDMCSIIRARACRFLGAHEGVCVCVCVCGDRYLH